MYERYREPVDRLHHLFMSCPDPDKRERSGGWSIREIAGHLVDSASNNHQRILRYIPHGNLFFPAYAQDDCVRRAGYDTFDYPVLVSFWHQYNLLFLHMIERIPKEDLLVSSITIGEHPSMPLGRLIEDYYAHMEHHERQVKRIREV